MRYVLMMASLIGLITLIASGIAAGDVVLHGTVYQSTGNTTSGYENVWIGIYIDANRNGEYEDAELHQTNSTDPFREVTWDSENGTYSLTLYEGAPNWNRGDWYIIVINGSAWEDSNATCHEQYSTRMEWQIPETGDEKVVDVETRFLGFKINEFVYDSLGDLDDDEWIEIYNTANSSKTIDGWYLSDNDGARDFKFGDIPDVPPYAFIVVHFKNGTNDTAFHDNVIHLYANVERVLENDEDQISLYEDIGKIVDFVAYCSDGYYDTSQDDQDAADAGIWSHGAYVDTTDASEGDSIGLLDDGADTNSPEDWIIYVNASQGETNENGVPIPEFGSLPFLLICLVFVAAAIWRRR